MTNAQMINTVLSTYGLSNFMGPGGFNWWNIIWGSIFGLIGWLAFSHGKKERSFRPMVIGIVMMVYTFFVANTWLVFLIGLGLTAALYFWRE
ncbi:MAG: amino acid transport protein [Candidatus Omnitrophica bacterium]|nr:amino acid transport protein [Candidatus Omnitrophota bacterium]MDE2009336.1 amino acid transport protein [Candidatus Omnitrophota bacterium]MDE2214120.1 amino acid transport protein [Candidatus Omnitrophota bacterium]MDE2231157.1 amino acid transport protein [Candidatus Omnitrophota bacterium]